MSSVKKTNRKKMNEILNELDEALPNVRKITVEYGENDYKYFTIKDCHGNMKLVQELQRMTRWQWRVWHYNESKKERVGNYFEISGQNKEDFDKIWKFLLENWITLSS